ncbi:COMM domain-containing protein [Trichostrongylus colubriformis]|uniref:COMM domain-containing protein n=1 Tax=Trichostrongylus colubriformis TaxID=6319 RepID=A0AAN8FCX5_TRICO
MSQPQQPVFPQDIPEIDVAGIEKIGRSTLNGTLSPTSLIEKPKISFDSESFGLTSQETESLLSFFTDFWRYLIYHRLGGMSLANVLKSSLPPSYVETIASLWYSEGPFVYTHLARRTASDKARVQDVSWSVWTETARDYPSENNVRNGIRLNITTDKGVKSVFLTSSQVANLHSETVRIQAEIDKLLE